jgi:hypothetical protein
LEQDGADKVNGEAEVHSFIVRMWLEEVGSRRVAWHGQITYVRNGELRYFKTLDEIPGFIRNSLLLDGES